MKLSELLDHVAVHVLDDRTAMLNGSPDELWSQEALVRYFREAENLYCRKARVLKDSESTACCEITLVANQKDYDLHTSVLGVLSVTPADNDLDLIRFSYDAMRPRFDVTPDHFDVNITYTDTPGRPLWYATDIATRVMRLRPTPDADAVSTIDTLNLRVVRMPLVPLSLATPDAEPEIPGEYHLSLCDYVAFRALSNPTVDDDGKKEARTFKKLFDEALRSARGETITSEAAPVQWRFGGWAIS